MVLAKFYLRYIPSISLVEKLANKFVSVFDVRPEYDHIILYNVGIIAVVIITNSIVIATAVTVAVLVVVA